MRKRILCISALSLLLVGVFVSAASATTYYGQLSSMTLEKDTLTTPYTEAYSISVNVTFTLDVQTSNPGDYAKIGTTDSAKATVTASAAGDVAENFTGLSVAKVEITAKGKTATVKLTGTAKKSGVITVTGSYGGATKTATLTVTIKDLVAPEITGSISSWTTGTANDQTLSIANAETISIDVPDGLTENYGLTVAKTKDAVIGGAAGEVTFSGTPKGSTTGVNVVITAQNYKGTTKKTYSVKIKGIAPSASTFEGPKAGGTETTELGAANNGDAAKPLIEGGAALNKTNLVFKFGKETGATATTGVTTPLTITASGLPSGVTLVQDKGTTAAAFGYAEAHLEGTPTTAGHYTVTISATNAASSQDVNGNLISSTFSKQYSMDVLFPPEITTTKLRDITWGSAYNDVLTVTGGITGFPIETFFIYDGTNAPSTSGTLPGDKGADTVTYAYPPLPDGLLLGDQQEALNARTGAITTTKRITGTFNKADSDKFSFGLSKDKTIKFKVAAGNALTAQDKTTYPLGFLSKDVEVTIKSVKPSIQHGATVQSKLTNLKLTYHGNQLGGVNDGIIVVEAKGPGTMSWDVSNLPAGLQVSQDQEENSITRKLRIYGSPDVTVKNQSAKLVISNGAGNDTLLLKFNVTSDSVKLTPTNLLEGIASVDKKITSSDAVTFEAEPGPITWTAKNLPSGLKLSIDKSVSYDMKVYVIGKLKSPTKVDKNGRSIYEVTATNKVIGESKTVSADYKVYEQQKISTNSLSSITLGKAYKAKLSGSGGLVSTDYTWEFKFRSGKNGTETTGTYDVDGKSSTSLSISFDQKTNMPTIVGSIDRFPKSGDSVVPLYVTVSLTTPAFEAVSKEYEVKTSGTAPKFTTTKISDFLIASSDAENVRDVKVDGTKPFTMRAYIDKKAAKTHLNTDGKDDIPLTSSDSDAGAIKAAGGFWFTPDENGTGKLHYKAASDGSYAFNGLPITFAVKNDASQKTKSGDVYVLKETTKSINVNVKSNRGLFMAYNSKKASNDVTILVPAGETNINYVMTVSGDKPYTIELSPKGKTVNGLTISEDNGTVTISGTPAKDKASDPAAAESKTAFTVKLTNPSTKKTETYKVTVIGVVKPAITTRYDSRKKEVEVGKTLSIKLSAKGSKKAVLKSKKKSDNTTALAMNTPYDTNSIAYEPMTWTVSEDVSDLGLEMDAKTGTLKGIPKITTSDDTKSYALRTVHFIADNGAGTTTVSNDVRLGVKGRKFKITTRTLAFYRGSENFTSPDMMLQTDLKSNDATSYVKWAWDSSSATTVGSLGFSDTIASSGSNGYMGQLSGTLGVADKGKTLKIKADNVGQIVTGSVKISVYDPKPLIAAPTQSTINIQALDAEQAVETVDLTVDPSTAKTGDTKFKWELVGKPGNSKLTASIKQVDDGATVTLKLPKNLTSKDLKDKLAVNTYFTVSVQNVNSKQKTVKSFDVTIYAVGGNSALPAEKDALPEDEAELTEDEELPLGEGTVTYGDVREESALTQAERRVLTEGGYIIAAILPEITADESGLYDLEAVSLDEAAPEGYELVWFAFPRNAEGSEDDTIAEFYDEAGAEIFAVPEGRVVVPAPWLEKDVTYAPVIAVRAPLAGDAKDSLDDAEEGDTVTENALEEAAEAPAAE